MNLAGASGGTVARGRIGGHLQEEFAVGAVVGNATYFAAYSIQTGADHRFEQTGKSDGSLLEELGVVSHS